MNELARSWSATDFELTRPHRTQRNKMASLHHRRLLMLCFVVWVFGSRCTCVACLNRWIIETPLQVQNPRELDRIGPCWIRAICWCYVFVVCVFDSRRCTCVACLNRWIIETPLQVQNPRELDRIGPCWIQAICWCYVFVVCVFDSRRCTCVATENFELETRPNSLGWSYRLIFRQATVSLCGYRYY
jgi:hypothetical protein